MSVTMQEVVAAARAGDKKQAQVLLAQYIQANPDDAKGWYLMSQLVDSKARRAAYLSKTLALDPYHERAWAEFYSLPTEVINKLESANGVRQPPAAATPTADVQPDRATAAAPLTDANDDLWTNQPAAPAAAVGAAQEQREVPAATRIAEEAAVAAASPAKSTGSKTGLTVLLVLLILATIAVLVYLLYLLLAG